MGDSGERNGRMRPNNTKWIVLTVIAAVIGAILGPMMASSLSMGAALVIFVVLAAAVIGFLVWSLAANKVGKRATPAMVTDARGFGPTGGSARLYVVRRGFMGGLAGMKVTIAGIAAGQVRMNQFVMAELPPGTYTVDTEMARNGMKSSHSSNTVTLAPGEVTIVRAMLAMRATHAMTVQEVLTGEEGRSEIMRATMVQWTNEDGPSSR